MRDATTVLNIIRDRGQRGLPLERLYRQLYNRDLYLRAYGKLYANKGAMTTGTTSETVDQMSLEKIDRLIAAIRQERYRWKPVRRTYIPKHNGKRRPLGMPSWSDKLLQEVIRSLLEAYYEPQFSDHSHGFRAGRGCHSALHEIKQRWKGVKWFVEGDICSFFDRIDHSVLLEILGEKIRDNRFIRLLKHLLQAGYLEDWRYHKTHSGVPQGGIVSPILSNLVLDRLDKFVEQTLIPMYTKGQRRKTNPPYVALTREASQARKVGDLERARQLNQRAQKMPSRDPNDPNFRRLRYVRYADDWLIGFSGTKAEARDVKQQIATFLQVQLRLELSQEKTLITHAREDVAHFLGYEIHTLDADSKHDHRGQRCINGAIGLRIPRNTVMTYCAKYQRSGKPIHLIRRVNDSAYSIVANYQAEYRGIVQYYRLAYNLHTLSRLKWVMETSLAKTLALKFKTSRSKVYRRFKTTHTNEYGTYKVLEVTVEREIGQPPLVARFGGVPLQWNKWVQISDSLPQPIWSRRSEVTQRLLAQVCELCGATDRIEVHHIRKLADLKCSGQKPKPNWVKAMAARKRKTLVVCQTCHQAIHAGRYDKAPISK
ncbi:MAG: reverse transcriptase domain-containing protein [Cyanobacteria bacterium J06635_15]